MSEIKNVKCKHCGETVGVRRHNEFRPLNAAWQKHKRSFVIECPFCHEWQMFPVNQNDVKMKLSFAV